MYIVHQYVCRVIFINFSRSTVWYTVYLFCFIWCIVNSRSSWIDTHIWPD